MLSKIIAESQGILRDINKRAKFTQVSFNDASTPTPLPPTSPSQLDEELSHVQNLSFVSSQKIDLDKVSALLKKLCGLEAIQEERMMKWIRHQTEDQI